MFIDCSKLPDHANPVVDDVYTSPGAAHTVVVTMAPYRSDDLARLYMRAVRDGTPIAFEVSDFAAILVSLGLRPWGRLDRSATTRPEITRDPELVDQRLTAFGPHHRALREQYGLSMGELARALGCPPARLSMLELAEPDPVREGTGVREDEGRAALAELLAETVARTYLVHRGQGSGAFEADVWSAIHEMLNTGPAQAAMATILKARGAADLAANPGTSAWHRPPRALTQAVQLSGGGFAIEVYEQVPEGEAELVHGGLTWQPVRDEGFARAAAAVRWPGVALVWQPTDEALYVYDETALKIADAPARGLLVVDVPEADDVAKQTARAGLAQLIGDRLREIGPGLDWAAEDFAGEAMVALDTDEARRLIRLHG